MLEFRWKLPGGDSEGVALRVHAWHGWLGRKVLTAGTATVFRRGWSEGIEARFFAEGAGGRVRASNGTGSRDGRVGTGAVR